MKRIDVEEYQKKLEKRLLLDGFVKLDEPMDTKECCCVGMKPDRGDYNGFNQFFWYPAIHSILRSLREIGVKEYYCADVYYSDFDVLCVTVGRGECHRDLQKR